MYAILFSHHRYTYGKGVEGKATITVKPKSPRKEYDSATRKYVVKDQAVQMKDVQVGPRHTDNSFGGTMWDSGISQWLEQCGIVGYLSG